MSENEMIVADADQYMISLRKEFPVLDPNSRIARAVAENGGGLALQDLPGVKFPQGTGTLWSWTDVSGEHNQKTIVGFPVFFQKYGLLWPTNKNTSGDKPLPVMETDDMITASLRTEVERDPETQRIVAIPGTNGHTPQGLVEEISAKEIFEDGAPTGKWNWNSLTWTQFGSSANGRGKYAQERMKVLLLRSESHLPLKVDIPSGSLSIIENFFKQIPVPYWQCKIQFALRTNTSKDDPFAELVPTLLEIMPEESTAGIDAYHDQMVDSYAANPNSLIDTDHE